MSDKLTHIQTQTFAQSHLSLKCFLSYKQHLITWQKKTYFIIFTANKYNKVCAESMHHRTKIIFMCLLRIKSKSNNVKMTLGLFASVTGHNYFFV